MKCLGLLPSSVLSNLTLAVSSLSKYWQPKVIFAVDKIPHTETGKIARSAVINMIENFNNDV